MDRNSARLIRLVSPTREYERDAKIATCRNSLGSSESSSGCLSRRAARTIGRTSTRTIKNTQRCSRSTIECLGGELPVGQRRLVEAWTEIHGAELQADWELLQSGRPPVKIDPLR